MHSLIQPKLKSLPEGLSCCYLSLTSIQGVLSCSTVCSPVCCNAFAACCPHVGWAHVIGRIETLVTVLFRGFVSSLQVATCASSASISCHAGTCTDPAAASRQRWMFWALQPHLACTSRWLHQAASATPHLHLLPGMQGRSAGPEPQGTSDIAQLCIQNQDFALFEPVSKGCG